MNAPDAPATRRSFRDHPLGRVAMLVAVLLVALVASRSCGGEPEISKETAIETARKLAVFTPDNIQVRFIRRGVPPHGYWAVSMYQGQATEPSRVQIVIVDAKRGVVFDDGIAN